MTDTDKLREAIEFYDDSQDEQVSGEVHHNHLRSLVAAGRLVLASQSASGEVETAEAEYARWDTGYDSAIGGAFVGRLQDGFTWNAVSPGEHRGYDIVSVHTDHDLAGKERRSRALAAALTAAALWRQANGTGEIGRLKRRIDLRLNIVSRAFGEATATEQPAPQAAPAPIVEALCEAERALANAATVINPHVWSSVKAQCEEALAHVRAALASARAGEGAVVAEDNSTSSGARGEDEIRRLKDRIDHRLKRARLGDEITKTLDEFHRLTYYTTKDWTDRFLALIAGERT